jgi:hypothetical protein
VYGDDMLYQVCVLLVWGGGQRVRPWTP